MLRSGLVVEVPSAEHVVGGWRTRLDAQAALGVPPHVTVLFPFAEPDSIDTILVAALRRLFATTDAFEFRLTRTARFDDRVLWLAPEPAAPFQRLTRTVTEAFPSYPPYGGQFAEVVPHLTVGERSTAAEFDAADVAVRAQLPIACVAHAVSLMVEGRDGRWKRHSSFRLAEATGRESGTPS